MKNILNQKIMYRNYLSSKLKKLTDSILDIQDNVIKKRELGVQPLNFENNSSNDMSHGIVLEYFHNLVLVSNKDDNKKTRIFYIFDDLSLSFPQLVLIKRNEKEIELNSPFSLRIHSYFIPAMTNEYFFKITYLNGGFSFLNRKKKNFFQFKIENKWNFNH